MKYFVEIVIVLFLCSFPLCLHIDSLTLRQWDEARNAVHTVEMLRNGNYLVRMYNDIPETWEPKPPLLIWLQLACVKLFGLNELAIRLPSVIAAFMTAILLILYFARFHSNRFIGYMAAIVLVSSHGYIDRHIARTGDHDALLILFSTAVILHFYRLISSEKPGKSHFLGICLLLILGVFTKSVAILLILPGLLLSVFVFKAAKKVLLNKWLYISFLIFILITGSYYTAREIIQPGYLDAVWHWELFPRYANTENNFDSGTFWFYALNLFNSRFIYWIWFLLISVIALPFLLRDPLKKFYWYIFLNTVSVFVVLSSGSKGLWYDGLLFPLFAIIISLFIERSLNALMTFLKIRKFKAWHLKSVAAIILLIVIYFPFRSVTKKVTRSYEYPWDSEDI